MGSTPDSKAPRSSTAIDGDGRISVNLRVNLTARSGGFERLIQLLARKRVELAAIHGETTAGRWSVELDVVLPEERLTHVLAAIRREVDVIVVGGRFEQDATRQTIPWPECADARHH
jgi:hypothetical protein